MRQKAICPAEGVCVHRSRAVLFFFFLCVTKPRPGRTGPCLELVAESTGSSASRRYIRKTVMSVHTPAPRAGGGSMSPERAEGVIWHFLLKSRFTRWLIAVAVVLAAMILAGSLLLYPRLWLAVLAAFSLGVSLAGTP